MIINVIGDVTGFAKTLEALHAKMPVGEFWGLGDLIDRGPASKEALDYFINNGFQSLMGNHEHMMLWQRLCKDPNVHGRLYPPGCWGWNGGNDTAKSFGFDYDFEMDPKDPKLTKYFDWIEKMPVIKTVGSLVMTHAPISGRPTKDFYDLQAINKDTRLLDQSVLWNRFGPYIRKGAFQVYGHNSTKGILWHTKRNPQGIYMADPLEVPDGAWGVCIDTWREGYLSGLSIDTDLLDDPKKAITVFQQEVRDPFDFETPKKKKIKGIYEV